MTWCYRLAALAVAVAIVGCASSDSGGAGGAGTGGGGEGASDGAAVVFADASPLSVAPGQAVRLAVRTDPPGPYDVTFLLLGDSLDASLDRGTTPTDPTSGDAAVTLLAPSKAASFKVRAAVGSNVAGAPGAQASAEIVIRVSELGIGALRVLPDYQGSRKITTWRAAVLPQAKCEDFAPPDDPEGADIVDAPVDEDLIIEDAMVGPNLAVIVRSEHKVWGCADTTLSHAGEFKEITVPVLDRAVDLSTADLDLALTLVDPLGELESLLQGADERLIERAFPTGVPAATALLDAMGGRVPPEVQDLFVDARGDANLDGALAYDFKIRDVELRAVLRSLLRAGRPLDSGFLRGRLSSAEADAAQALLRIESLAGVDANRAGVPDDHLVSFVANPGDTVVIGAESGVLFLPTRLVGARAEDVALGDLPAGAVISEVLANEVGCWDVATVVGQLGDCDAACIEATCRLALGDVWSTGLDASAEAADLGVLTLVVSGDGVVDDEAALIGLDDQVDNTWVGVMHVSGLEVSIGGAAAATEANDDGEAGGSVEPADDDGESESSAGNR